MCWATLDLPGPRGEGGGISCLRAGRKRPSQNIYNTTDGTTACAPSGPAAASRRSLAMPCCDTSCQARLYMFLTISYPELAPGFYVCQLGSKLPSAGACSSCTQIIYWHHTALPLKYGYGRPHNHCRDIFAWRPGLFQANHARRKKLR